MMEENLILSEDETPVVKEADPAAATEKHLLFLSEGLLFGASANYIVEIITNHPITTLPLVPSYIRGIINLRGQLIPIVDIRQILGQSPAACDCIVILNIHDTMVGILVDTVQKMIDVPLNSILPAPNQEQQKLVSGMCSLAEGQTMLVFDCAQLLCLS